jgi:polyisoprenoid-binding protein YceI
VSGTFVLDPENADSSRAVIRAPVASFDSGNDRRDRKMREVTEAERYPTVRFRATEIQPLRWGRTREGRAGQWRATGTLTFHGRTHPVDAPVMVRVAGDSVRARAQFAISLTRFEVERPSLLWASIADTIRIDARIVGAIESSASSLRGVGRDATGGRLQKSRDGLGRARWTEHTAPRIDP